MTERTLPAIYVTENIEDRMLALNTLYSARRHLGYGGEETEDAIWWIAQSIQRLEAVIAFSLAAQHVGTRGWFYAEKAFDSLSGEE